MAWMQLKNKVIAQFGSGLTSPFTNKMKAIHDFLWSSER